MAHPHPKTPLQKTKLHLFILSAYLRKNKSDSYELLLKTELYHGENFEEL